MGVDTASQQARNQTEVGPGPGSGSGSGTSASLRWLLFVMGPLLQAIRLASFKGVFWSKFIGFSFLLPWALCEVLIFLHARMRTNQRLSPDLVDFIDLDPRRSPDGGDYDDYDDNFRVLFPAIITTIPMLVLGYAVLVAREVPERFVGIAVIVAAVPISVFIVLLLLLMVALGALFKRYEWVGRGMLVAFVERVKDKDVVVVDDKAFLLLIVFLVNFLICVVGYAWFYDSEGTVNPGWTGVFG
ncbi:hypothetical protein IFR05_014358 [Cadophora sp. M221]|nr:hypothetical protein IFR05_014358 [Cadophora sp. M221]